MLKILFFMMSGWIALSGLVMADTLFPRGCQPIDFKFSAQEVVLNETGEQRIFLLYNHSPVSVELRRYPESSSFMSPSLSATLAPGMWGAFASDIAGLSFSCHVVQEGKAGEIVSCASALDICEYPRAKFALSNMGNYWVSANKSQHDIITDVANKGIYLRW